MSNRPLIPASLFGGTAYNTALNFWDYFSVQQHGLNAFNTTTGGWQTVLDITESGILNVFWVAVKNTSGSQQNFGCKITIDGAVKLNNTSWTVAASSQSGICAVGRVVWFGVNTPGGCTMGDVFYDTALKLEVWVDTGCNLYAMYKYIPTVR